MASIQPQKKKILIVDDDARQLALAREVLEQDGYLVLSNGNGLGITSIIERDHPDLLLLDIALPVIPGDDLALFLRADSRTRHIPIVFYSGLDEEDLSRSAITSRVRGYIRKGDIGELRRKVSSFLHDHDEQVTNEAFSRQRLYNGE
jgi:CheY-like chemotaxis protein